MCGLVVSVSQALGITIGHPVVVTVALQLWLFHFLHWPVAHAKCPVSQSLPAGRIAASPLYFPGSPQHIGAPLSSVNDISLAHVVNDPLCAPPRPPP